MQKEPCGIVIVNKEEGITSQGVVNRVKRIFGAAKAGHTGTLDPMATGVLPVLIGRTVKASEFMLTSDKHYGATLLLGVTTDTEDVTGTVLSEQEVDLSEDEVLSAIDGFVGQIMQIPPMYSALKVGGKKLCDLARRGETVEREARAVTVHSIEAKRISDREYYLDVVCSKGTYIRTLCNDIGEKLGCGGAMASLCRSRTGSFDISSSHTLAELEKLDVENRISLLIPTESLFTSLPAVSLPEFYEKLSRNGCEIYQSKIKTSFPIGTRLRMCSAGGDFYALGEVQEYENGSAIKTIKLFDI